MELFRPQRPLFAAIVNNPTKPYDGTTTATLTSANLSLSGLASGDGFTITPPLGVFASADVSNLNSVTAALASTAFTPTGGTSANDYILPTMASGADVITPVSPTITVSDAGGPYTGLPIYATASVTGVKGGAAETNAVAYAAPYIFTGSSFGPDITPEHQYQQRRHD